MKCPDCGKTYSSQESPGCYDCTKEPKWDLSSTDHWKYQRATHTIYNFWLEEGEDEMVFKKWADSKVGFMGAVKFFQYADRKELRGFFKNPHVIEAIYEIAR